MEIQDLADKIDHFQGDFNDHKADDREWKVNHEKADHEAFQEFRDVQQATNDSIDELKTGLQGLYTAQRDIVLEIRGLRDDMKYGKWLFDGSKGFSLIPKQLYILLLLVMVLTVFGFKAVIAFIIDLIR